MPACAASNSASRQIYTKILRPNRRTQTHLRPNRQGQNSAAQPPLYITPPCMANVCRQRMQPHANTFLPAVRLNRGECKATHVLFWRAARPHLYVYIYIYILEICVAANKCDFKSCKNRLFLATGLLRINSSFCGEICYTKKPLEVSKSSKNLVCSPSIAEVKPTYNLSLPKLENKLTQPINGVNYMRPC